MFTAKNSFIRELRSTVDTFGGKVASLSSQAAAEEEKFKSDIITQTYRNQRMAEIQKEFQDAQVEAVHAVAATQQKFNARVDIWATPAGSKLDVDLELLKGSITLTQDELVALIEKHKGNAIMQRAFKDYASKAGFSVILTHDAAHKKEEFQRVVIAARSMLTAQTLDRKGYGYDYYEKHWDEIVQPIDDELGDMKEMYTKSEGGNMPE